MNRLITFGFALSLAASAGVGACSSTLAHPDGAAGAGGGGQSGGGAGGQDASGDASLTCSYPDGGAPDGGAFQGVCPAGGCPSGTVCVVEIGGVAGGGGEYCAPVPLGCHGTPSCACMASCVCTHSFGGRPEACSEQNGSIACDDGIR